MCALQIFESGAAQSRRLIRTQLSMSVVHRTTREKTLAAYCKMPGSWGALEWVSVNPKP